MENRVAGRRRVGKELRLLAEEVAFVGVDVHRKSYQVSVWTEGREWVAQWSQPADCEALCRRLEPVWIGVRSLKFDFRLRTPTRPLPPPWEGGEF